MSNFKKESLVEAKRVISNLISETSQGKAFQFEGFIQGLSEEIEEYWQPEIKEGLVHFHISESGELLYEGVVTEMKPSAVDFYYSIGLKESLELSDISDTQLDVFTLLSNMKESHFKEKSKILESLDQISADFDKKLIEVIKKAKASKTVSENKDKTAETAEKYLNLDIATKKAKLLDQLLKGK